MFQRDLVDVLKEWIEDLRHVVSPGGGALRYLELLVTYVLSVNEEVSVNALAECLSPLGEDAQEMPMTVGERLIEKGRQEGRQEALLLQLGSI